MTGDTAAAMHAAPAVWNDAPDEIRLDRSRAVLTLVWPDGLVADLAARTLREDCQSAGSKRTRLAGLDVQAAEGLRIAAVRAIGSYAVNIVFSDGHDRGIYPWPQLRGLSEAALDPAS